MRIRTDGKDLEKIGVGYEIEPRELVSLTLKIFFKLLLAIVKIILESGK
jgi:hypothetical protein